MEKESKIYLAGHRGLVGSALKRKLESKGYTNIIFRTHKELDLTNQQAVNNFFSEDRMPALIHNSSTSHLGKFSQYPKIISFSLLFFTPWSNSPKIHSSENIN